MKFVLLYAMPKEVESLLELEGVYWLQTVAGVKFYHLRDDAIVVVGGVGKVNAAMAAQLAISLYSPEFLINVGVAGAFSNIPIGTFTVVQSLCQHDVDTSAVGDPVGLVSTVNEIWFPTFIPRGLLEFLEKNNIPHFIAKCTTGDWFAVKGDRANQITRLFSPDICDMEGCAVAQVCLRNAVTCIVFKTLSDSLSGKAEYDFNLPEAMRALNREVIMVLDHWEEIHEKYC